MNMTVVSQSPIGIFDDGQGYTAHDKMTPEDIGMAPIAELSLGNR